MKKIQVALKGETKAYPIIIGKDSIRYVSYYFKLLRLPTELAVITNTPIKNRYKNILKSAFKNKVFSLKFFTTIDSEKAKSISNAVKLIESLADYAKKKKITVVAFGGGVIGDLASFVASIYKRGVALVHIPTTLLAQIDSSIGGKTAIDLTMAKNLLGTFYQPRAVFCDTRFLVTLDKRQLRAGFAEAVKYAIIKDDTLFRFLEVHFQSVFSKDAETLEHLVYGCAKIKSAIVSLDEKEEKGIRTILNFGHTIGHAIEAAGKYEKYTHGEAIAMGMIAACRISQNLGLLDTKIYQRIINLIANLGLPQEITGLKERDVLNAYRLDKKFIGKINRFVLIKGIGRPIVYQNVPEKLIYQAVRELFIS